MQGPQEPRPGDVTETETLFDEVPVTTRRGHTHTFFSRGQDGVIRSDKVLLATNVHTSTIGKIRRSVLPVWDYQIATEPLTDEQLDRIACGKKSRHALADYVNMFHYFRLTKDNRIT